MQNYCSNQSRRNFLKKALWTTALTGVAPSILAADETEKRPNIIFLLTDDQCRWSMGCYGNPDVKTPNLDQLAADGLLFENHYNTTAICMASRASIFTGVHEYQHGCNFDRGDFKRLELWEQSYPALLKKAGYMTAFAGKFGFNIRGANPAADFDFWGSGGIQSKYETAKNAKMKKYAEDYPHSTLSYAAFSEDVIGAAVEKDQPFCLSISFKAPHRPWTPDPQFDDLYSGFTFTRPGNFGPEHAEHLSPQSKTGRQWKRWTQWGYNNNYDGVMAQYHELIHGVDVAVGRIRDTLKENGLDDNTVIIFTSDNGFLNGAHGFGGKVLPLEESSGAPLIIYDPRSPASTRGKRSKALTGNIDFAPTILELAGQSVPEHMDGVSLLPLIQNPDADVREHMAFIQAWPRTIENTCLSVLTKDWKYTYWWYSGKGMQPVEELFNTEQDPLELKNLASDSQYNSTLETMRGFYDEELQLWNANATPLHGYKDDALLFERRILWSEKEDYIQEKQ